MIMIPLSISVIYLKFPIKGQIVSAMEKAAAVPFLFGKELNP